MIRQKEESKLLKKGKKCLRSIHAIKLEIPWSNLESNRFGMNQDKKNISLALSFSVSLSFFRSEMWKFKIVGRKLLKFHPSTNSSTLLRWKPFSFQPSRFSIISTYTNILFQRCSMENMKWKKANSSKMIGKMKQRLENF